MSDSVPSLDTLDELVQQIQQTHQELSAQSGKSVNTCLTLRNWLRGHHISQHELCSSYRAQYGEQLSTELAKCVKSVSNCNPPVSILRIIDENHAVAEYALAGLDNPLFIAKYQLELPKKEEMQRFIADQINQIEDAK